MYKCSNQTVSNFRTSWLKTCSVVDGCTNMHNCDVAKFTLQYHGHIETNACYNDCHLEIETAHARLS